MNTFRMTLFVVLAMMGCGCASVKKMAIRSVADSLAQGGDTFSSDEDPELVREALPFALKTYESLLAATPRHEALLVATAAGFTSYSQGFIARDAELMEDEDIAASMAIRRRAQLLDVRARDYALRALDVAHPGLQADLLAGRLGRLSETNRDDIPALFWAGASWGAAVAIFKNDTDLISDLPAVKALIGRVLELDETFERGSAHEVMMSLEAGLAGGNLDRAAAHYQRALALSGGHAASTYVTFAEAVCVNNRDRAAFLNALTRALAVAPDGPKNLSVANRLAQDRARWLQDRVDELFVE